MKITLNPQDIHYGSLILVNADYPVVSDIEEKNCLIPADTEYPLILMENKSASVLSHLMESIQCVSQIVPVSGYRSLKEQEQIYADSLLENGEVFTKKFVALPGHSEHQTGLAIDLGLKQENIDFICPDFPYSGVCQTFRQTAPEYGFIERYPENKESVTGIGHEPWHFRYVGYPHSYLMTRQGQALEEYIQWIKQFTKDGEHGRFECKGTRFELFYLPLGTDGQTTLTLPDQALCQISGNNVDGWIVTM